MPAAGAQAPHLLNSEDTLRALGVNAEAGLDRAEVSSRIAKYGPNELTRGKQKSPWRILYEQFASILVVILLVAAVLSLFLGDVKDAAAILFIVILNALLGFKQEYGAEKAMEALQKLSVPKARVRRDGETLEIDAGELVPGDIVLLEAGNLVPADGRLFECASVRVEEAALTGESVPVEKSTDALPDGEASLADRKNMVYMGTIVAYGRCEMVVTATAMHTELGRVADLLESTEKEQSPLADKIHRLGKVLIGLAGVMIALVAVIGLIRGYDWRTVFLTAVSMAVAAVPEGLPAVVTIALALGAKRMFARQALIRRLPAVETLGSVTAICTDKTGTLTQNRMTVTTLELPDLSLSLPPPTPGGTLPGDASPRAALCLAAAALCNDAVLKEEDSDTLEAIGDPTEGALVIAAAATGMEKAALENMLPRVAEAPFDSDRKRMSTAHRLPGDGSPLPACLRAIEPARAREREAGTVVFTKGAASSVLEAATGVLKDDAVRPLTDDDRRALMARTESLAGDGVRVLAVAFRFLHGDPADITAENLETDLVYVGLIGMADPLREDVKPAVETCVAAGIRPIMITGDHPLMARSIGVQLGMPGENVVTGVAFDSMNDEELKALAKETSLFARVSPEQKLRIVDALQADGEIVAMTGDGVNDAPAIKSSDIGVAMGLTGTDVAKAASDMVLLDDSYNTIVAAVREGRVIFDNIRRFIRYILASNTGELLVMLVAPLLGMPIPLLPVQILWMNLVTDGLPALALGVEKGEEDIMSRPPRNPQAPILDRPMVLQILWIGTLMAVLSLGVGYMEWAGQAEPSAISHSGHEAHADVSAETWQTMLFTTMVMAQLFLAFAVRSARQSVFKIGLFSNRPLVAAFAGTLILQLMVIYVPLLQNFFKTTPLTAGQLGICMGVAVLIFVAVELAKFVPRRPSSSQSLS
ncbi:MAG: cation-translocating P-type ATPase [Lentisphaerae bacterium]|nr:cation-translocating P-type ATPase [Lentisphaerota bacterium]